MLLKLRKRLIFISLSLIAACGGGGGGGSNTPSPSLTTNLPSSAFDDETLVITVSARNFGSGDKTYNATSNSLTIEQGSTDNQFLITGISSTPGNHTITFSASDTSGTNASLNSSIRIDAVPTGYWEVVSLVVDGVAFFDFYMYSTITRGGRVFNYARTAQDDGSFVYEKCMGSQSVSARTLTFESWCADSIDSTYVDEEGYRVTGELEISDDLASGTYSVYESSGAFLGQADVALERYNLHADQGLLAPQSAAGVYVGAGDWWAGASRANEDGILTIDNSGNIDMNGSAFGCFIEGSVAQSSVQLVEGNDFVRRGIFDSVPLSQLGCFGEGKFGSGNRDISAGEGILELYPNGQGDEDLWIYISDSLSSYTGAPGLHIFYRLCTASGDPTPYGLVGYGADFCDQFF